MHILLIHQAFAAVTEPGGTRHHELAQHLVTLGHEVTIIASPVSYLSGKPTGSKVKWLERQIFEPHITIIRTYSYPALHKSFVHRVISFVSFMVSSFVIGLTVKQVDLVWGTSPPIFQGVTAWLLARIKRTPFLFEVRDLWPEFAIAVGVLKNPILIKASLWLEKFLYRRADQVIVNSPGFLDHVKGMGAQHVELIPNGVNPDMFDPDNQSLELRRNHQLSDSFVALYAGAHGMSNDLGVVLEAAKSLKKNTQIKFVLIGDGKEKSNLMSLAEEMQLGNILFLPPVPKNHMSAVLSAADTCIAILKPIEMYKTTYPNKVFDYMAAGKPIVLAIDGVIRQLVEQAEAGLAVPPGDPEALAQAVQIMASDREKARAMGASGRLFVEENFNRQLLASKLNTLMENMKKAYG